MNSLATSSGSTELLQSAISFESRHLDKIYTINDTVIWRSWTASITGNRATTAALYDARVYNERLSPTRRVPWTTSTTAPATPLTASPPRRRLGSPPCIPFMS
uniref:G protein-coupled receptor domain containing protein n=1 Tax=Haemonchus contortus TaxID=6289 RepID=A0A7I4YJH1_HAECO